MELTDATRPGETRGSIRALSKLSASIRQLALTLLVYETKRSASVETRVGDMIVLYYSKRYCQMGPRWILVKISVAHKEWESGRTPRPRRRDERAIEESPKEQRWGRVLGETQLEGKEPSLRRLQGSRRG